MIFKKKSVNEEAWYKLVGKISADAPRSVPQMRLRDAENIRRRSFGRRMRLRHHHHTRTGNFVQSELFVSFARVDVFPPLCIRYVYIRQWRIYV